jgi:hypothetical protein
MSIQKSLPGRIHREERLLDNVSHIPIYKPNPLSYSVIANSCKVRGNLIEKGEIPSVPSQ